MRKEDLVFDFCNRGIDLKLIETIAEWAFEDGVDYKREVEYNKNHYGYTQLFNRIATIPDFRECLSDNNISVTDEIAEKLFYVYQEMVDLMIEYNSENDYYDED